MPYKNKCLAVSDCIGLYLRVIQTYRRSVSTVGLDRDPCHYYFTDPGPSATSDWLISEVDPGVEAASRHSYRNQCHSCDTESSPSVAVSWPVPEIDPGAETPCQHSWIGQGSMSLQLYSPWPLSNI